MQTEYDDLTVEEMTSMVGRPPREDLDAVAEPSIEIIHWTAGLLEGRGCFADVGGTPRVTVQSTVTSIAVLSRLKKYWGGSIYTTGRRHRWVLTGNRLRTMLKRIRPYLSPARRATITKALKLERVLGKRTDQD